MTESIPPIAATQEFQRQLTQWLEQWAAGHVNDQHSTYLNKIIKARVDQAVAHAPAKAKRPDSEVIRAWVERFAADQLPDGDGARRRLEEIIARRIADARAEMAELEAPSNGAGEMDEELLASMQSQEEVIQRLSLELARAADWRFNLEAHARQAHAAVKEFLASNRAPTKEAMNAVLSTLRAGIEWTP